MEKTVDSQGHESLEPKQGADELISFVQQLSPQYRLVFDLFAIEGYTHKEISKMLDISEGTSKSNLARARAILQEKVKNMYHLPATKRQGKHE